MPRGVTPNPVTWQWRPTTTSSPQCSAEPASAQLWTEVWLSLPSAQDNNDGASCRPYIDSISVVTCVVFHTSHHFPYCRTGTQPGERTVLGKKKKYQRTGQFALSFTAQHLLSGCLTGTLKTMYLQPLLSATVKHFPHLYLQMEKGSSLVETYLVWLPAPKLQVSLTAPLLPPQTLNSFLSYVL